MIRRSLKWIMPALLLMCVAMSAHEAQARRIFIDGNELVKMMDAYERAGKEGIDKVDSKTVFNAAWFVGYISGVADETETPYFTTKKINAAQVAAIVAKFLKENPEKWSEPGNQIVTEALKKAFPLKKSEVK